MGLHTKTAFSKYLIKYLFHLFKYPFMKQKDIFTDIYKKNVWGNSETVSGHGSTLDHVESIQIELPKIIKNLKIGSILDIPCGDLHWMKHIDFDIKYIGADIVESLIEENRQKYPDFGDFLTIDISSSILPKCDLIFCRDCLVHLSFKNIFASLKNINQSNSKYLMMTNFPMINKNTNTITGAWRALNFQLPPFNFPEPILIIEENPLYRGGRYPDKSLALWEIKSLKKSINQL